MARSHLLSIAGVALMPLILFAPASSRADSSAERAGGALLAGQLSDGRFATEPDLELLGTVEAVLAVEEVAPQRGLELDAARFYLSQARPRSLDLEMRRSMALCGDRAVVSTFGSTIAFAKGGPGASRDATAASVYEAIGFVEWLIRCDGDIAMLASAVDTLLKAQRPNGGFAVADNDPSIELSAMATIALARAARIFSLQSYVDAGARFLLSARRFDGSFGQGGVAETALAVIALSGSSLGRTEMEAGALNLEARQGPDGSFGSTRDTALAARALKRLSAELSISPVGNGPSAPLTIGVTGTVRVFVVNGGAKPAIARVGLYDENPFLGGHLVSTSTLIEMPARGVAEAVIAIAPDWVGPKSFIAWVDDTEQVFETNEDDNFRVLTLEAETPISLSVVSVHGVPEWLTLSTSASIRAVIGNAGSIEAQSVTVELYREEEGSVLTQYGTEVLAAIPAHGSESVDFLLGTLPYGRHDFIVRVVHQPGDPIEQDDIGRVTLEVRSSVDLHVPNAGIVLSSNPVLEGRRVEIRIRVENRGTEASPESRFEVYDGRPDGALIGEVTIPALAAGGSVLLGPVSFTPTGKTGWRTITVLLDPEQRVDELDEQNTFFGSYELTPQADLALLDADVAITPAVPEQEQVLTFTYRVRNLGSATANANVEVEAIAPDGALIPLSKWASSITAGGNLSRAVTLLAEKKGEYRFKAYLVDLAADQDIDSTNNRVERSITVVSSTRPDLVVDARVEPSEVAAGAPVSVRVAAGNRLGLAAISMLRAVIQREGEELLLGEERLSLEPGQQIDRTFPWDTNERVGAWKVIVEIDALQEVAETKEDNNRMELPLVVFATGELAPVDLVVTAEATNALRLDWTPGPGANASTVRGYRVYRDGVWINKPLNLAISGVASASSEYSLSYSADKGCDGAPGTYWRPLGADTTSWWMLTFPLSEISEVAFSFNAIPRDFDVELLGEDGQWQTLAERRGNAAATLKLALGVPRRATAMRYRHVSGSVYLREAAAYGSALVEGTSFIDAPLAPGRHFYVVRAEISNGGITVPSNEAEGTLGDRTPPPAPASLTATLSLGNRVTLSWPAVSDPQLAGYRLYRTGLHGASLGRFAGVVEGSAGAETLFDGAYNASDLGISGASGGYAVAKLEHDSRVSGVNLVLNEAAICTYAIDLSSDGKEWSTVQDRLEGREGRKTDRQILEPPVQARYVRLREARCSSGYFRYAELEVYVAERQVVSMASLGSTYSETLSPLERRTRDFGNAAASVRKMMTYRADPGIRGALLADRTSSETLMALPLDPDLLVTPPFYGIGYKLHLEADVGGGGIRFKNPAAIPLQTTTTLTDYLVFDGPVRYEVVAVDLNGNESVPTSASVDFTVPVIEAPRTLKVASKETYLQLTWITSSSPAALLDRYEIYRAGEADPIGWVDSTIYAWDDTSVSRGQSRCYEVEAVAHTGARSVRAGPVCAALVSDDLTIAGQFGINGLTVVPARPVLGRSASIVAVVRQLGREPIQARVGFFDGKPEVSGTLLGEVVIDVAGRGQAVAVLPWIPTGASGEHELFAVVDPLNEIAETNEANNRLSLKVDVNAAPTLQVSVGAVNSSAFSTVEASLAIRDSVGLAAMGIRPQDLTIFEDGVLAQIVSLIERSPDTTPSAIDLVFAFDISGSMTDEAQRVCELIDEIQWRVRVLGVDLKTTIYGIGGTLSSAPCLQRLATVKFNGALVAAHVEDWGPATTYLAEYHPWHPGAIRIVLPISDEGAYNGDNTDANDHQSIAEAIAACQAHDVHAYPIYSEINPGYFTPAVVASAQQLAAGTGGVAVAFPEGAGVADHIVSVVGKYVSEYLVTFLSPNPVRDGTVRQLEFDALWRGLEGVGFGQYTAPLGPGDLAVLWDNGSSVHFSPAQPNAGEAVAITARVANLGPAAVDGLVVRFFDGEPVHGALRAGNDAILSLPVGGVATVATTWIATSGRHQIHVVADPENLIVELDETNNVGVREVLVAGSDKGDLLIEPGSVRATPADPIVRREVTVEARIAAVDADFYDFPVTFFWGDPAQGGALIGTVQVAVLEEGQQKVVSMAVTAPPDARPYELWAVVDPMRAQLQETYENDRQKGLVDVRPDVRSITLVTDRSSYPAFADALVQLGVTSETPTEGSGTITLFTESGSGTRLATFDLTEFLSKTAAPGYRYRILATTAAQDGVENPLISAQIDFAAALAGLGRIGAELALDSLRVFEVDALTGALLEERPAFYGAGKLTWLAPGDLGLSRHFQIVFDEIGFGPFQPSAASAVPFPDALVAFEAGGEVHTLRAAESGWLDAPAFDADPPMNVIGAALADFNRDTLPDLVESNGVYSRTHLGSIGPSGSGFSGGVAWDALGGSALPWQTAEANGDRFVDLLRFDSPRLAMGLGLGDGMLLPYELEFSGAGSNVFAAADFDLDGKLDIVRAGSPLALYRGSVPGEFASAQTISGEPGVIAALAAADLDGDRLPDLVAATSSGLWSFRGVGGGTFQSPARLVAGAHRALSAVDTDGDGRIDLVALNASNELVRYGNSGGTIGSPELLAGNVSKLLGATSARRRATAQLGAATPGPGAGFQLLWPIGQAPAGEYRLVAEVAFADGGRGYAEAPVAIRPTLSPTIELRPAAPSYRTTDFVAVRARIANLRANIPITGLLRLTVTDPHGGVAYQEVKELATIPVDGEITVFGSFALEEGLPGIYRIDGELLDVEGETLALGRGPMVVLALEGVEEPDPDDDKIPTFHYAVCATNDLTIKSGAIIEGENGGLASVGANRALTVDGTATILGDAVCGGAAVARNQDALVSGTLYYGGTLTTQNNPRIGALVRVDPPPAPCACDFDLDAVLDAVRDQNDNALLEGKPFFANGRISLTNRAAAVLPGGSFYLESLSIQNESSLTVERGATAILYVRGNVSVQSQSTLGGSPANQSDMVLVSGVRTGSGTSLVITNRVEAALSIYAPYADLVFGNTHATLHGAIVGRNLLFQNNQRVVLTGQQQVSPPPMTCP